jgi:hypothetical protein
MNCIFGLFDILGFKSFCENCDSKSSEVVFETLDSFETDVPEMVFQELSSGGSIPPDKKEIVLRRLRWLIFSDTVFVAMPIDDSDHPNTLKFNLIFFAILVKYINRRMFEIGLPVRGCVHIGEVFLGKRCFAGKAIAYAYDFGQPPQAAATVVSNQANQFLLDVFSNRGGFREMFEDMIVECEIPTKNDPSEKFKTLCWFYLNLGRANPFIIPNDLNKFITDQFTALGKTLVEEKDKAKIKNTEKLFKDWQAANHLNYLKDKFHCR